MPSYRKRSRQAGQQALRKSLARWKNLRAYSKVKRLYRGLKSTGFEKVVTFEDIKRIYKI